MSSFCPFALSADSLLRAAKAPVKRAHILIQEGGCSRLHLLSSSVTPTRLKSTACTYLRILKKRVFFTASQCDPTLYPARPLARVKQLPQTVDVNKAQQAVTWIFCGQIAL